MLHSSIWGEITWFVRVRRTTWRGSLRNVSLALRTFLNSLISILGTTAPEPTACYFNNYHCIKLEMVLVLSFGRGWALKVMSVEGRPAKRIRQRHACEPCRYVTFCCAVEGTLKLSHLLTTSLFIVFTKCLQGARRPVAPAKSRRAPIAGDSGKSVHIKMNHLTMDSEALLVICLLQLEAVFLRSSYVPWMRCSKVCNEVLTLRRKTDSRT